MTTPHDTPGPRGDERPFLLRTLKWWLPPLVIALLILAVLILVSRSGSESNPFEYTPF